MNWLKRFIQNRNKISSDLGHVLDDLRKIEDSLYNTNPMDEWDSLLSFKFSSLDFITLFDKFYFTDPPQNEPGREFENLFSLYITNDLLSDRNLALTTQRICSHNYEPDITFFHVTEISKPHNITATIEIKVLHLLLFLISRVNNLTRQLKSLEIRILEKVSTVLRFSYDKYIFDMISLPPPIVRTFF